MAGEHGGDSGSRGRNSDEGAGTIQQIINFFAGKGLGQNAIAAILGNMQVESNFSTRAYNGNEGAIGLAQWEGGRRTALQRYAANHGLSETDLNAQLGYYWYELNHGYSGVLRQLRAGGSAGNLAAVVDGQFEVSSGSTRSQRVANAEQYAASGLQGIKGGNAGGAGAVLTSASAGGGGKSGGYAITGSGTLQPLKLSRSDYKQALGDMAGLLNGVPQLKQILNQAVAGGWSESKFEQAVEQSKWWQNHSDDARKMISLQYQDPAEYKQQMAQGLQHVKDLAGQMGVTLSGKALASVTHTYLYQGWDDNALNDRLADWFKGGTLRGQAAAYGTQLQQIYGNYGIPMGTSTMNARIKALLEGTTTMDTYTQAAKNAAKSMYPSLATQLDAGQTVKDIADPYVQTMGNLLEIDPNSITLQDPLIKRALQGSVVTTNGKATATSTPLYQFETTLRNDPRWANTDNAHQTINSAIMTLGKDFGFEAA